MAKKVDIKEKRRRKGIRKTLSLIAGLSKKPSTAREARGFAAEDKALEAANYWKRKKIILKTRQTEGLGIEDREMKDLILTLLDEQESYVQVKDYCDYKMVQKCREKGVLPFPIWPDEGEDIAKERMLNLIISAYISGLTPFQVRQVILKILEIKQLPEPSLVKKIFPRLRKVFS